MGARSALNTVAFPVWTAFMVTYAVGRVVVSSDPEAFAREQRHWARGFLNFADIEVMLHGGHHMDPTQPYVLAVNHQSYLDIPALFSSLPSMVGFLAKRELNRVPFLATALERGGHVLIDRTGSAARSSLAEAGRAVHGGRSVVIFPEGSRGGGDVLGSFKAGAFHLAKSAQVPVLPVGLRGTHALWPRNSGLIRSGKIDVHVGEPIPTEQVQELPVRQLSALARERVAVLSGLPLAS